MATDKQVTYALTLLAKAGYSTKFMGSEFKALGATMSERKGKVADWLKSKTTAEMSQLIEKLRAFNLGFGLSVVSVAVQACREKDGAPWLVTLAINIKEDMEDDRITTLWWDLREFKDEKKASAFTAKLSKMLDEEE